MDGWEHAATADPDPDSWDAVPATADEAGVTAAEHVKASNGTAEEAAPDAIPEPVRRAVLSRQTASARCSEAAALHAQARQAIRRTVACAADVLALREAGLGNIAYVRALWAAFEAGGVAAMAALVPADVQWRPLGAAGRVLNGTRELTEFGRLRTLRCRQGAR